MKSFSNIELKKVSVKLAEQKLLDDISFNLESGHHLAIFGPGGSGKTLLAKAIKGEVFHSGEVVFSKDGEAFRPKIVFVPVTPVIKNLSNLTGFYYQQRFNSCDAEDSLTLREELLKHGAEEKSIEGWLQKFQLLHRVNAPVIQLSNGELKKMQIISYLLTNPDVLILDKVFTGLDSGTRKLLHVVLNELAQNSTTIILITDTHEMPQCITHFAELSNGKLLRFEKLEKLGFLHYSEAQVFHGEMPEVKHAYHVGPLIQMRGVSVKYGEKQILKDVHWSVLPGECWLVKGANGAGKSTLMSLINADNPQAYSQPLYLFGRKRGSGETIWDIKKKIGFVSPELHKFFDNNITVFNAIASGFFDTMGVYKPLSDEQRQKVTQWINYSVLAE
ncbi:MAG: ATP-binding cassette domain-containing protein [Niabella sp.]